MRAEHWWYAMPLRLRSLFRRREVERDLDDELRFHIDAQITQFIARGMTPEAARTAALTAMGGVERRKEESRDTRGTNIIENIVRDVRHGVRALARNPVYTVVAIVTLTLGVGAITAIFSVVNGVLFRPLAYADPASLVTVSYGRGSTVAAGVFADWQEAAHSFSGMGVEEYWTPNKTGGDRPEQMLGVHISTGVLPMLGVKPMLGRVFLPDEGRAGHDHVLVLGYACWKTRFGGDSAALSKTMTLNGEPYTIVGVMPPGFQFAPYWANNAAIAAPLALDARRNDRAGSSLRSFARLGPGVPLERARAEMREIAAPLEQLYPGRNRNVTVTPIMDEVVSDVRPALAILLGAVAFVLLIACANVAHLQLVRAAARSREFALRGALGASSGRIVQQSLIESALIALAGGVCGLLLAQEGVRALVAMAPPSIPRVAEVTTDWRVFAFTLAATVVAGAIFGAAPAFRAAHVPSHDVLKESGRAPTQSARQRRVRGALIVSEFALALVLLAGAGLVMRSFVMLLGVDPGFNPRNVLSMQVSVAGTSHAGAGRRPQFFHDLIERAGTLPGVTAASAISHLPLDGDNWHFPFDIEGRPFSQPGRNPKAAFLVAHPGYFGTMGIPMVRGRDFSQEDVVGARHIVIVSESMARHHWPNEDPIGKRITVDDVARNPDWFTIVGVARDVRQSGWTEVDPDQMYFPYEFDTRNTERSMSLASFLHPAYTTLVLRATSDPAALTNAMRSLVQQMDPDAVVSSEMTMQRAVQEQLATPKFYVWLIGGFAVVALVLAGVGVYGVVNDSVARRAHEIGVRVALGARRGHVLSIVAGQGMKLAVLGTALGLAGACAVTRYARTLLYHVTPTDPATFIGVAVVLSGVAVVACWIPAQAALGVSPSEALRGE